MKHSRVSTVLEIRTIAQWPIRNLSCNAEIQPLGREQRVLALVCTTEPGSAAVRETSAPMGDTVGLEARGLLERFQECPLEPPISPALAPVLTPPGASCSYPWEKLEDKHL